MSTLRGERVHPIREFLKQVLVRGGDAIVTASYFHEHEGHCERKAIKTHPRNFKHSNKGRGGALCPIYFGSTTVSWITSYSRRRYESLRASHLVSLSALRPARSGSVWNERPSIKVGVALPPTSNGAITTRR